MTDEEWNLLHRQVCGFIRQWVDDNVLNHISGETHARTLWEHLESLYARKTGNNKMFLIKQMLSLKCHDGSPMTDHLNNFQGIMNQLSAMGIKFQKKFKACFYLVPYQILGKHLERHCQIVLWMLWSLWISPWVVSWTKKWEEKLKVPLRRMSW